MKTKVRLASNLYVHKPLKSLPAWQRPNDILRNSNSLKGGGIWLLSSVCTSRMNGYLVFALLQIQLGKQLALIKSGSHVVMLGTGYFSCLVTKWGASSLCLTSRCYQTVPYEEGWPNSCSNSGWSHKPPSVQTHSWQPPTSLDLASKIVMWPARLELWCDAAPHGKKLGNCRLDWPCPEICWRRTGSWPVWRRELRPAPCGL